MSLFDLVWNNQELRLRAPIRLIIVSLLVYCSYWLVSVACLSIRNDYIFYLSDEILTCLLTLVIFAVVFKYIDKRSFVNIGFVLNKYWFKSLFTGAFIGFVVISINFLIMFSFGFVKIEGVFATDNSYNFLLEFMGRGFGFLAVSISEELFVRGYLLINIAEGLTSKHISAKNGLIASLFITSIIFGVLHFSNFNATIVSSVNLLFIGLLFGYAYLKTGSFALPIGIHFAWNFTMAQLFGLNVSGFTPLVSLVKLNITGETILTGGSFGPEGGLLILISVVIGILLVHLFTKSDFQHPNILLDLKTTILKYPQII
ncbi:MAG: type II CAAX endopeptidase family protein [bacterium]